MYFYYPLHYSETVHLHCWRVRLQTPYGLDVVIKNVRSLVFNDLKDITGRIMGIAGNLYITSHTVNDAKEYFKSFENFILGIHIRLTR